MDALPAAATHFHFDKSLLTRLQECRDVLQPASDSAAVPASRVRSEWAYFVELQIEPAGWLAYWRMPRIICESFGIAYPTVVFGCVEAVAFGELRAHLLVTGVQDAAVRLPERHEVALVDLLPVREQENDALNIETTANCVDMLRFFYQHVWRPWDNDNDDDLDWATQHLERRIRFHHDLVARRLSRPLAVHVRALLAEALDVQQRREYLETDISDDEDVNETKHKTEITDLMRLHLRLANIRNELEILENPEMREIYEDVRQRSSHTECSTSSTTASIVAAAAHLIVCPIGPMAVQRQHLDWCERQGVSATAAVRVMPSLQHCLDACLDDVTIYLPAGRHAIKFAEPLLGNLTIVGRRSTASSTEANGHVDHADTVTTCIVATEDDSKLLQVDGHLRIDGCTLDCGRVRTGIVVRRGGHLQAHHCHFVGAPTVPSNTKCAVSVQAGGTDVRLVDCSVRHFAVGVTVVGNSETTTTQPPTEVRLSGVTEIADCGTAVECAAAASVTVHLEPGTRLGPNRRYGCAVTAQGGPAKTVFEALNVAEVPQISGSCEFVENGLGNVVRFGGNAMRLFDDDDDENGHDVKEEKKLKSETPSPTAHDDRAHFAVPRSPKAKNALKSPGTDDEPMDGSGSESEHILVSDTESEYCESSVIMVDD